MAMTHWKLVPRKKFESPAGFLTGLLTVTRCRSSCCCCGGVDEETTPGITALIGREAEVVNCTACYGRGRVYFGE